MKLYYFTCKFHLQSIMQTGLWRREAIELYPAESRVVDKANQYHLWVMPEGVSLPIGWRVGVKRDHDDKTIPGAMQRPFDAQ